MDHELCHTEHDNQDKSPTPSHSCSVYYVDMENVFERILVTRGRLPSRRWTTRIWMSQHSTAPRPEQVEPPTQTEAAASPRAPSNHGCRIRAITKARVSQQHRLGRFWCLGSCRFCSRSPVCPAGSQVRSIHSSMLVRLHMMDPEWEPEVWTVMCVERPSDLQPSLRSTVTAGGLTAC